MFGNVAGGGLSQFHHPMDWLRPWRYCRRAECLIECDDADTAERKLPLMGLRRASVELVLPGFNEHKVVGDQRVALMNAFKRETAFSCAGGAANQHPLAMHAHKRCVLAGLLHAAGLIAYRLIRNFGVQSGGVSCCSQRLHQIVVLANFGDAREDLQMLGGGFLRDNQAKQ